MGRVIGIRYMGKKEIKGKKDQEEEGQVQEEQDEATEDGSEASEARGGRGKVLPTTIAIVVGKKTKILKMKTEAEELDWIFGKSPAQYREVKPNEDLSLFFRRHIKGRKLAKGEKVRKNLIYKLNKDQWVAEKVPIAYEGLMEGDMVAMILGGNGDAMASKIAEVGENMGVTVMRIPPHLLKEQRVDRPREKDPELLAALVQTRPELFYKVGNPDRQIILVRDALRQYEAASAENKVAKQRLYQRERKAVYQLDSPPENTLEERLKIAKAESPLIQLLEKEVLVCNNAISKSLDPLPIWHTLNKVKGMGPRIAAGIIGYIVDINRFATDAKLKKFCGFHVDKFGRLPRLRKNETAEGNPEVRQAVYLLVRQFASHKGKSEGGQMLLKYIDIFTAKHPMEVIKGKGGIKKTRYNPPHIKKMAKWRTGTKWVEWLFRIWKKQAKEEAGEDS